MAHPLPRRFRLLAAAPLAAALVASGPSALAAVPAPPVPFSDVGGVPWATPAIGLLVAQGAVKGVAPDAFAPALPVTQEQAVTFLARLFPDTATAPAQPLPGVDAWAQASVAWAEAHGVVSDPGAFAPTAAAPRAQVVAWVVRALGLADATAPAPTFADAAAIPARYAADVGAAQADGLVVGDPSGNFRPLDPVTRAEVAVILLRAEEALAAGAGAAAPAPFAWQVGPGPSSLADVLTGTALTGSHALPAGTVNAGRFTGAGGSFAADFAEAGGVGAGTLVSTSAGQSTRTPVLWREPGGGAPGALWLYYPGSADPLVYTFTVTAGSVQVTAASDLAAALVAGETLATAGGASAGTETATASLTVGPAAGGGALALAYSGPEIPAGMLIATETAAVAAKVAQ
jgi:hypothetical protein